MTGPTGHIALLILNIVFTDGAIVDRTVEVHRGTLSMAYCLEYRRRIIKQQTEMEHYDIRCVWQ